MAIAHIQGQHNGSAGAGDITAPSAGGTPVTSGNAVCGVVAWGTASNDLTSLVDDKLNTYNIIETINDAGNGTSLASFYLLNITNGPSRITTVGLALDTFVQVVWDEYSGVATSAALDGHHGLASSPGTGADAVVSGTFSTVADGDLIYSGAVEDSELFNGNFTQGTGFTKRTTDGTPGVDCVSEDLVQSTHSASTQGTWTQAHADGVICVAFALKAAGGGAPTVVPWPFMRGLRVH